MTSDARFPAVTLFTIRLARSVICRPLRSQGEPSARYALLLPSGRTAILQGSQGTDLLQSLRSWPCGRRRQPVAAASVASDCPGPLTHAATATRFKGPWASRRLCAKTKCCDLYAACAPAGRDPDGSMSGVLGCATFSRADRLRQPARLRTFSAQARLWRAPCEDGRSSVMPVRGTSNTLSLSLRLSSSCHVKRGSSGL